jgi:hypothetical protein
MGRRVAAIIQNYYGAPPRTNIALRSRNDHLAATIDLFYGVFLEELIVG